MKGVVPPAGRPEPPLAPPLPVAPRPRPPAALLLLLLLLPAVIGVLAGLFLEAGPAPVRAAVPVVFVRVQFGLGILLLVAGVTLSVLALAAWGLRARWRGAVGRAVAAERRAQAESHRRFIRRLDHELKNPLTAMRAALANLAVAGSDGPGASLQTVGRQVDRLSALASDLRKLADLDSGSLEQMPVPVEALLEEAAEMAREAPGRAGKAVQVSVECVPWAPAPISGDRDLLLLALYNLLDNALKFSPPDATVELRAREDGTGAAIEVADTGQGIPPEDIPHVAEELYRGQGARWVDGSGLGLALVERVVALHGGSLAVRSRLGQGTVVTLRFPGSR